jgi:hypothetical protein
MKEGSLFVLFYTYDEIHRTRMLQIMFLVCLASSQGGGGVQRLGGFMAAWTCGVEVY